MRSATGASRTTCSRERRRTRYRSPSLSSARECRGGGISNESPETEPSKPSTGESEFGGSERLEIRPATEEDVPLVLWFIRELAEYERLAHEVTATEEVLRESLFGERRVAEALLGYSGDSPAAFALFFHNFSTFLGRPGIYLEDLFVRPEHRGKGFGREMLRHLARLARERGCGRLEWWVLDWNEGAIRFYESLGAVAMDDWTVFRVTDEALEDLAREPRLEDSQSG